MAVPNIHVPNIPVQYPLVEGWRGGHGIEQESSRKETAVDRATRPRQRLASSEPSGALLFNCSPAQLLCFQTAPKAV